MTLPKSDKTFTRTVQIGKHFEATMTFGAGGKFVCEWSPDTPRRLKQSELKQYRDARDGLIQEAAEELGIVIALSEDCKSLCSTFSPTANENGRG